MPNHPATPPDPNKPGEAAARTKMRRPNRLRGPDAPAGAAKGRQAAFVPKLLFEILSQPQRDTLPEAAQQLFVQAYNYGLEEYHDPEHALHLGWAAVHRHYDKVGSKWGEKPVAAAAHPDAHDESSTESVVERLRQLHHR
jgi:cation transport regulator ChaB